MSGVVTIHARPPLGLGFAPPADAVNLLAPGRDYDAFNRPSAERASGPPSAAGAPWPGYRALLAINKPTLLNIGRRVRLAIALRRTAPLRFAVDRAVAASPWLHQTLRAHPVLFSPLLGRFLDARLLAPERFACYAHDLEFTSTRIQRVFPAFFRENADAVLWTSTTGGYSVALHLNLRAPQEGLWQLSLRDHDGETLFSMSFAVLPGPTLFIGAVQGGRSTAGAEMSERIRRATRDFEGLRPHFLLIEIVRALADAWHVHTLVGVDARQQIKIACSRNSKRCVHFAYDAFFEDLGAERLSDGGWSIPAAAEARPLEDVPTRKRAMYRRRRVMVAALRQDLSSRLVAVGP